jgi:hypothetical protein
MNKTKIFPAYFIPLLLISFFYVPVAKSQTITLTQSGCTSPVTVGSSCMFTLNIQLLPNNATNLYVELFSSDNTSPVMVQICRTTIKVDDGYNFTEAPKPLMMSSFGSTQVKKILFCLLNY